MRYTDKKGTTWVDHHRVIAGGRFIEATVEAYAKDGGKAEPISRAEYDAARRKDKVKR